MNLKDIIFRFGLLLLLLAGPFAGHITAQTTQDQNLPKLRLTNPLDLQPRQLTILGVEVEGVEPRTRSFVVATAGLSEGTRITFPGEDISNAIRRLYRTGLYSDVRITSTERVGDGIYLHIFVQEQPRLEEFKINGVRRSQRRELEDRLPLRTGFAVTEASKAQAVQSIKRYYEEKGYRNTQVEVKEALTDSIRNRVTVTFTIDRGERIQIGDIIFEGNEFFSDRKLRRELDNIKRNRWWRLTRQTFRQDEFDEDLADLMVFYRNSGFRDARVVEDSVFVFQGRRGREEIGIFVRIEEGPQYHVRNVTWEGNTVYTDEQLTLSLGFERGDVFNEERFQQNLFNNRDESDVFSLYHNIGYLFLQIEDDIRVVDGDSLDLHFYIIEDEVAVINRVAFTGNVKTHDDVVRRSLRTVPGNNYSRSAIMRSIRELATLGYFVPENIRPDLDYDFEDKTVDITFFLDESQSTDNFEFSGGYGGRQLGLILAARVNFNNFSVQNMFDRSTWSPLPSGDGQRLSLGVQVTGTGYQTYSFSFVEPWFRGRPNSVGVSVAYNYFGGQATPGFFQQTRLGRQELFAASVSYGRRLTWPDDYFTSTSRIQYQYFNVRQFTDFVSGVANVISYKETLERNSLDNFISPNSGSRITLSAEVAPPVFNFDQFFKLQSKFQYHTPIAGKLVGTFGVEYGYMGWFSDTNQSQYQRFVLGGTPMQQRQNFIWDNIDLRGYPGGFGGSVSPLRNGQEIGGSVYSKYVTEIRYPLVASDQIQVIPYLFAEGGNAFDGFSQFDPFLIKRAAGFGGRIFMPILGLIDLSYGYRFDGLPNTNQVNAGEWQFLINFGAPF